MHPTMKMPARLYAERDPETNEKRWYETPGMGDEYVRADEVERLRALVADYEKMQQQHREHVRRLDVALNGDGAANQASLIDLVAQFERR
jgi:hypothetical protein